jgi:tRNA U34 5-carboxymethylaminomethyl modifying GTPase MnmE/TrmE
MAPFPEGGTKSSGRGGSEAGKATTTSTASVFAAAAATAARGATGGFVDESLVAVGLRRGAETLADVTGAAIDIDLLDRIFSRHCIGK